MPILRWRGRGGRRRHGGRFGPKRRRRRRWTRARLARIDLAPALRGARAALDIVEFKFALAQLGERGTPALAHAVDAGVDREAIAAARRFGVETRLQRMLPGRESLAFGRWRGERRTGERQTGEQRGAKQPAAPHRQVSEVSTSRRASARNSADCISRRRETVRGNSCASGPSV